MVKINKIYGVGLVIILALPLLSLQPWFFPPDFAKTIVFRSILAVLLLLFSWQLLVQNKSLDFSQFKHSKLVFAIGAWLGIFLLASLFSVDPYFSFWGWPIRSGGFVNLTCYCFFAIFCYMWLTKSGWEKAWLWSTIIAVGVSLIAIAQYYGLFSNLLVPAGRPPSTMGNPILLAMYLILMCFPTLARAIDEKIRWKKIVYWLTVALFLYIILITASRAAYLGLLIGGGYFLLWYPKKIPAVRITALVMLSLLAAGIIYINTASHIPKVIQQNKLFYSIAPRLSVRLLMADGRFYSWSGIDWQALVHRPVLGYGPENFSVGFNKFYDPSLPYLTRDWGDWWDRAHNVLLDTGIQAGIFAIIAYLSIFVAAFWQLQKVKFNLRATDAKTTLTIHGAQATLIAYLTTNIFGFDSFSTYLLFFLLAGYVLHLAHPPMQNQVAPAAWQNSKKILFGVLAILGAIFIWQCNIIPWSINTDINKAQILANQKQCPAALAIMDNLLTRHSFLDSYVRLQYVQTTKTCNDFYPQNNAAYLKKGIEVIGQAVKIQPLYTRYWILLGTSSTSLAATEKDPSAKNELLAQAETYFQKALTLAPKYQEIPIEQARMAMVAGDYANMEAFARQCLALNSNVGDCHWWLGLSQIYSKNVPAAEKTLQDAKAKGYKIDSKESLGQLANAYNTILDWQHLVTVYESLTLLEPANAQYHSSLAFFYQQLGQYAKARQEALKVLEISPQSKANVDAFLQTLPR